MGGPKFNIVFQEGKGTVMNRKSGFTLVEVIVALALFAIIVVMVFPLFGFFNRVNHLAEEKIDAQEVAVSFTENVLQVSKTVSNKQALIDTLQSPSHYGTGAFLLENDSYVFSEQDYTIRITFFEEDKLIKVNVTTLDNQKYETLGWLSYAQ